MCNLWNLLSIVSKSVYFTYLPDLQPILIQEL